MLLHRGVNQYSSYHIKISDISIKDCPFAHEISNFGTHLDEVDSRSRLRQKKSLRSHSRGQEVQVREQVPALAVAVDLEDMWALLEIQGQVPVAVYCRVPSSKLCIPFYWYSTNSKISRGVSMINSPSKKA